MIKLIIIFILSICLASCVNYNDNYTEDLSAYRVVVTNIDSIHNGLCYETFKEIDDYGEDLHYHFSIWAVVGDKIGDTIK